ncbi:unnamed protein product, partial [marine sediment metagenome]
STLVVIPLAYLFASGFRANRPLIYFVWLSLMILFVLVEMRKDRLIVGLLCIAFAVWTFLADNTIGPAIGIGVLGLITVAIAKKR